MDFPEAAQRRGIVERYARLLERCGREIGERPLVLPDSTFFPDRFTGDGHSAAALVERMMLHAGLSDVPLSTRVVQDPEPESPHGGSCSSGCQMPAALAASVPRLLDDGEAWILNIPNYELAHPVVLTAMVARAIGHVFLVETLPAGARVEPPVEVTADYAAVALGFGSLMLEGAYIYSKGCGGPQVASVTAAALGELALVYALFIEAGKHSARRALGALGTTQKAALSEAHAWAKSNAALVSALRADPASIARGAVELENAKPWLFRVLRRSPAEELPKDPPAREAAPPRAADPKRDELRSLVDEALRAARADAE
jgi:hypothetical protein